MDPEFPVRKKNRLRSHDYSNPGFYFVTICTQIRKENVLCAIIPPPDAACAIVGAAALGGPLVPCTAPVISAAGPCERPKIVLTSAGEVVARYIQNIDHAYYGRIIVDHGVIMPDHVHLIIRICSLEDGPPRAAAPTVALSNVINALKGLTTKALGYSLWQRGYYDHVIRNGADLYRIRK